METKILVALCALILSLGSNVEGQDPGDPSSPSDGPLALGMSAATQAPLPGGSPSPPGSLSLPSTDSPKPASDLTDRGLSNNNNSSSSSSNDTEVVVKEVQATSVGVPETPPIPEKTPGPGNLTEETVQPSVAPSDNQTAPTHTPITTVLVHNPSTTPPHTPVHSTTPPLHAPHPSTQHPKTHSPITTTVSPPPIRPETHPTNTAADPQPSSTPSPNPETSNPTQPKQTVSPVPTTTTTTSPPAVPMSEPQTSSTTPLPASTPASSPPSQAKTHADIPSQLNVVDGEPVFHSGAPALDPLLAGLVSAFIVTAAIITLLLFIKLRRRDQRPEFRRLQDLPMDDMMEDTPLSMYSY
ncbi:hypothetical protein J4Q44_G00154970 [Coregonus suidteri]|uniref:Uncharacterized protein n=1 Tax=Coregonus suidteri TaxID=861788 RepID=A0AAN8LJX5_9TELE